MGYSNYNSDSRHERAFTSGYATKSVNEIFTQNTKKELHKDMNPHGVVFRESCDSEAHPNAIPIQFYMDVTGSMGHIPHDMIKDGLPTLMSSLIQNGVPDAALLFGAIGDHECDRCPLQIAQFESGDAELDMWLTRTYIEGNGGGNGGESYLLAWYFAAFHVKTDSFNKRNQKGFVFTIGDEPCLQDLPVSALQSIMGSTAVGQGNYTLHQLLAAAQEKNHVFHIHINHNGRTAGDWKQLMGDHLIEIDDYKTVSRVISDTVIKYLSANASAVQSPAQDLTDGGITEEKPIPTML